MAKPAPPTSCVGESGVRSSGCSSSSACSSRSSLSNSRVGDDRRVPHVVAELVFAHLVGELLPAAAQVGVRSFVGLLGQHRLGIRGCLRAHPGRLIDPDDTKTPAVTLDGMPHPIMFSDDDLGLAEVRKIAWSFPEAFEKISWGRPVFCAPKMFVMYGGSAKTDRRGEYLQYPYSILVKVDESDRKALEQDTRFFFPAYMGPFGWLGLDFAARKKVDWSEVRELVDASFRLVAPKKLIKQLDEVLIGVAP